MKRIKILSILLGLLLIPSIVLGSRHYGFNPTNISGDMTFKDDIALIFGTSSDFHWEYDSANGYLQLSDGTNDFLRVTDAGTGGTFAFLGTMSITGAGTILSLSTTGATALSIEDSDSGFSASTLNVENGGRDFRVTVPQDVIFNFGGSDGVYFEDGGNIGIGDPTPDDLVDITGGALRIQAQADDFAIVNTTSLGILKFFGDDDTASADEIGGQIEVVSDATWTDGAESAYMAFSTMQSGTLTEAMRIDSGGRTIFGHTDALSAGGDIPINQVIATDAGAGIVLARFSNNAGGTRVIGVKSRSGTKGSQSIVSDNDEVLAIRGAVSDGVDFAELIAQILIEVDDATPAANDIGGAMVFQVHDGSNGASGLTERMRISSLGNILINNPTENGNMVGGIAMKNGTAASAAVTDGVQIYAEDTTGESTSTLGLYLEQAVEAIGTFTAANKIKVVINGTEYWIQLDPV